MMVAAARPRQSPAVSLEDPNDIAHFHDRNVRACAARGASNHFLPNRNTSRRSLDSRR
jgi:hypothetical protein